MADLVVGSGHEGKTIVPDGLKASEMAAAQQAMLLALIDESAGTVSDSSGPGA